MEETITSLMGQISTEIDAIKVEIAKSNERKLNGTSFNCAALQRVRMRLLALDKLGYQFRRDSIKYQKGLKNG